MGHPMSAPPTQRRRSRYPARDSTGPFTLTTTGQPDRTYTTIAQARADGNNARVWGGMHYPSTVAVSDALGAAIAAHVDQTAMRRRQGFQR